MKCDKCDKWKGHQNFAAKRLNDARLKVHQRKTFSISCKQCVGTQIVEIECTRCSETKGLEEYAKSQRKPDTAVCMACMEKQLELDPISGRQYEDNRDAFMLPEKTEWPDYWNPEAGSSRATDHATEHATDTSSTGGVSLNESMSHLKLSSKMGPAFSAANGADPSWKSSKSQSLLIDVSDDTAPTAATAGSSATTGFNPNKYGNPCSQSVGSSKTWSTNVPGAHSVKPVGKSGWAKIPAYVSLCLYVSVAATDE